MNIMPVVKFARFEIEDTIAYGVVDDERVTQIDGSPLNRWEPTGRVFDLDDVRLLVPCEPTKVLALAGNYRDHLGDRPAPKLPQPFHKPVSCLVPHESDVVQPPDADRIHYEAEMVVVIGRRARRVAESDALDFVLGITCGNDVSARDWQREDKHWWRAKGSDTFGPCGPVIVSGLDYGNLAMSLRVNGRVLQTTNTRNMIHTVEQIVGFISRHVTLEAGDLIYTGTPGQTTGLDVGDVVAVEIEGVGTLRNRIVAG